MPVRNPLIMPYKGINIFDAGVYYTPYKPVYISMVRQVDFRSAYDIFEI